MLSRLAREFAAEISSHDWSDAPYRLDRAGHQRSLDSRPSESPPLSVEETDRIRTNVAWVVGQVLGYSDPNFDIDEFVAACGIPRWITHRANGSRSGVVTNGLRWKESHTRALYAPGAPMWVAKVRCDVANLVVFERELGTLAARAAAGPGIDAGIDSEGGSTRLVTLVVRAWTEADAAKRAVEIVETASSAAGGGTVTTVVDIREFSFSC